MRNPIAGIWVNLLVLSTISNYRAVEVSTRTLQLFSFLGILGTCGNVDREKLSHLIGTMGFPISILTPTVCILLTAQAFQFPICIFHPTFFLSVHRSQIEGGYFRKCFNLPSSNIYHTSNLNERQTNSSSVHVDTPVKMPTKYPKR